MEIPLQTDPAFPEQSDPAFPEQIDPSVLSFSGLLADGGMEFYFAEPYSCTRAGLEYKFKPFKSLVSFHSGLFFDNRHISDVKFRYLRVPLGFNFCFGEILTFNAGGGGYYSLLTSIKNFDDYSSKVVIDSHYQFGAFYKVGLEFKVAKRTPLSLSYANFIDLSVMFREFKKKGSGGITNYINVRGRDYLLSVSVFYILNKSNVAENAEKNN